MPRGQDRLSIYLQRYNERPKSRIFAPLAELYRKRGRIDEGIKVLKIGMDAHYDYRYAHIVLAHCYYDRNDLAKAYEILYPFADGSKDNFSIQKLYAKICKGMGEDKKALWAYKNLEHMDPKNKFFKKEISRLEGKFELENGPTCPRESSVSNLGQQSKTENLSSSHVNEKYARLKKSYLKFLDGIKRSAKSY